MCKRSFVRASGAADFRSVARHPERPPSVIPASRVLWLVAFALGWMMTGFGGTAFGQVAAADAPLALDDSHGYIQ